MPGSASLLSRGSWALLALLALAFTLAWPLEGPGNNQNSQYALVRALASGTPRIDRVLPQIAGASTNDTVVYHGHTYSNKAPGLAFVALPAYLALRAAGMRTVGDPSNMLWALGLWAVVLPAVGLAVLVRFVGDRIEPGFGTVAAVATGLGTLVLPFATVYYAHLLAAFLAFAAFAILFYERRGAPRPWLVVAAGAVAGYAVTTDYPNALIAGFLFLYALRRTRPALRAVAYLGGGIAGIAPLLVYDRWAFGNLTRISYSLPHDVIVHRVFHGHYHGVGSVIPVVRGAHPSLTVFLGNMLGKPGLVTFAPLVLCGAIGIVLLWRRPWHPEAAVITAIVAGLVLYDSSFGPSFGGFEPGPRYLMAILPFLGVGLALSFRRFPATTGGLALVSGLVMTVLTATYLTGGYDARWFHRLAGGQFVLTAASFVGVTGWAAIAVFFAAAATAAACALLATAPPEARPLEALAAAVAVLGWSLLAATAPSGHDVGRLGSYRGSLAGLLLIAGAVLATGHRNRPLIVPVRRRAPSPQAER